MAEKERPAVSLVVVVTLVVGACLLYYLRFVLLPFLFAAAMAYIARPLLQWLTQRANGRAWLPYYWYSFSTFCCSPGWGIGLS